MGSDDQPTQTALDGWAGAAEVYAESFARLCAGTVEALLNAVGPSRPQPGSRLLDVGTGPGTVARQAVEQGYLTTGVDPEPSMVALATSRVPEAAFATAGLPRLPYPDDGFDAVTANFVLNHVTLPRASLQELRRVCRPGARTGLTIWPAELSPLNQLWNDVLAVPGVRLPSTVRLPEDEDFERTEDGLARLLVEAGFREVDTRRVSWLFTIAPEDLWRPVEAGLVTIGRAYSAQEPEVRHRIRSEYERRTPELLVEGELQLPSTALLAVGTA